VILLDTNALIWLGNDDPQLGAGARKTIQTEVGSRGVTISAISFWEIGLLIEKSRVALPLPLADFAVFVTVAIGIRVVPVNSKVAVESGNLPPGLHGDPGDRLIAATARVFACPLLTSDGKLLRYGTAGHLQAIDARL